MLGIAVLGLSVAAAPTAIETTPTRVEPITADAPGALAPPPPRPPTLAVAPPPPFPPAADPSPPQAKAPRARTAEDPLVEPLRLLASARAHLEAGRFHRALAAARELLTARDSQLAPEARAIEAIAACELALPRAFDLATAYLQQHRELPPTANAWPRPADAERFYCEKTRPGSLRGNPPAGSPGEITCRR